MLTDHLSETHMLFDYVSEARLKQTVLERYATVVAPDLRLVSDEQLNSIAEYVNHGGHLVVIGDFATQDEALTVRQPGSSEWSPLMTADLGKTLRCGRGKVTRCARAESLRSVLGNGASVLTCPNKDLAPHVKVNAFRAPCGASGRIVVHVVNYNVPLGVNAPDPSAVDGVELDMTLPKGTRAESVRVYAPEEVEPVSLPVSTTNGRIHIRIPLLRIYRVLDIQLK